MKFIKLGMFTALAMALSWAERFIPFLPGVLGAKIGFANIILILVLEFYGVGSALTVNVVRCVLGAALYGGIMSLPYSLCGGLSAVAVMYMLKKVKGISFTGMAVGGAFVHNVAQIAVACLIMRTHYIFTYLPFLGIVSVITGIFIGICSGMCADMLRKNPTI